MEEEVETILTKPKGKHKWTLMLVGVFLFIFLFVAYTSFVNPDFGSITGNVIKGDVLPNGISLNANLNFPGGFNVDSNMEKLDLKVTGELSVGDQRFELDGSSVVIDDFDGKIGFNDNKVRIDGKATKVFIEGIPITGNLKIAFDDKYSYIKLTNFYLPSLSYSATGSVRLDDDKIAANLNKEEFKISKYFGNLEKRGKNFKFNGVVDEARVGLINIKADEEVGEGE
jgi:hypothetical protein